MYTTPTDDVVTMSDSARAHRLTLGLSREKRKAGAVWIFRYRDAEGVHRKIIVGSVQKYPTKADAKRATERYRVTINNESYQPQTVAQLVAHYREKELTETSGKAFSTRKAYEFYFDNRILPDWGEWALSEVKPVAVEKWLAKLTLAPGTKAKLRNLMHTLFNHALRWQWLDRNPISLVRQSAKRQSVPDVLTAEEIASILAGLREPYRAMTFTAAVTGLRVSELLALKWKDIQFESGEIHVTRGIYCQVVGQTKTETSTKPLPLGESLNAVLLDWKKQTPYNQAEDWVFASPDKKGTQPLWPSSAMCKHIRPAAQRAGIVKHVRWHVFRHSFATLLKANNEDVKTTQELLRHADSKMTLDTYTQGLMPVKMQAQQKVAASVFPNVPMCANTASVSA